MRGVVYNFADGTAGGEPFGMSGIFSFLCAFCVGGTLLGALYILVPEGAFKKPLKYLFGVCFICCIISFFPLTADIDITEGLQSQSAADYTDTNLYAARLTFCTALDKAGIPYKDINVFAYTDEENRITGLEVTVFSEAPPQEITAVLQNENIKVSVINE